MEGHLLDPGGLEPARPVQSSNRSIVPNPLHVPYQVGVPSVLDVFDEASPEPLGVGGEGQVRLMSHKNDGRVFAVKFIDVRPRVNGQYETTDELKNLQNLWLRFPGIEVESTSRTARLWQIETNFRNLQRWDVIVMNYYPGGDLQKLGDNFHRNRMRVPEPLIWQVFMQISQALKFLHNSSGGEHGHANQCLHRDIKPLNILMDKPWDFEGPPTLEAFPNFVLADFGMSYFIDRHAHYTDHNVLFFGGTKQWQPPEAPIATSAGDVWALGAVVQWMALGELPIRKFQLPPQEEWEMDFIYQNPEYCGAQGPLDFMYWHQSHPRFVQRVNGPLDQVLRDGGMRRRDVNELEPWNCLPYSMQLNLWMGKALLIERKDRADANHLVQFGPTARNIARDMIRMGEAAWYDYSRALGHTVLGSLPAFVYDRTPNSAVEEEALEEKPPDTENADHADAMWEI